MKPSDLAIQLRKRYSKELYLGYYKSPLYHFYYGYKRVVIEVIKSVFYFIKSFRKNYYNTELSIFSTYNQYKALTNAKLANLNNSSILHVNTISKISAFYRLFVWTIKLFIFPFLFIFRKDKQGLYFVSLTSLLVLYCKEIVNSFIKNKVSNIYLSNDHSGDIFIISILLRSNTGIKVTYIQHGSVKEEFPENYFDTVIVYHKKYKEIYKRLCKKRNVDIIVNNKIESNLLNFKLPEIDFLICLSHQFPLFNIFRVLRTLYTKPFVSISLRFHPSDRLRFIKYIILKIYFHNLTMSAVEIDYISDFRRSKSVLCASSSLLVDAYHNGFANKLIWVKCLGLSWDYYNLENNIKSIDDPIKLNKL